MFRRARYLLDSLTEAIRGLCTVCEALREELSDRAPRDVAALASRIDELERGRALWEANVEGLMAKAEGAHRAARAAEERARHREKKLREAEDGDEGSDELPPEYRALLRGGNGAAGEEEELPAMRPSVGAGRPRPADQKAHATRMKFGG